ncbi:MAG TPA: FtsX-like permease family protein [Anaerolineae bacterium]|nr:FtsX-like permease family protein [Anaerolineae bacterium]
MSSLITLVWRNLTAHRLRSTLTLMAIALGVAMVLASSIVGQAAGQSAAGLSEQGPRMDLEVFSRDAAPFDKAVLDTLRASPDVEQVSPSLRVEVELVLSAAEGGVDPEIAGTDRQTGFPLTLLGVDPESYAALHEPELAGGTFLDEPNTIVLPVMIAIENELSVGDEVTLESGGHRVTAIVTGRLKLKQDIAALGDTHVAYVPLEVAQGLSDTPGQIDQVAIALRSGADVDQVKDTLAQWVGNELVVVKASAGGHELGAVLVQGGLVMAGAIILFAAGFVIMNAFAMSVTARIHEIGALRALGMTRRQVRRQVLSEAGLLGLGGAVLGIPTGVGLAWGVIRVLGTLDDVALGVPWWGASLSLLLGLGVTLVGALRPAQHASRVSPLVAVRIQRATGDPGWYVRHGGRVGGILLLILLPAVTAIVLIWHPDFIVSFAIIGIAQVGLLLSTTLLLPSLINPVVALARPFLVRWLGTAGRLAADNLGRNKLRAVLTAGALTAALTTIIATSGLMTATFKGGLGTYFSFFNEDGMLMPDIAALFASGELSVENSYEKLTTGAVLDPALVQAVESLTESGLFEVERIGFAPIPPELGPLPGSPGVFVEPEIFLRLGNFDFFEGDAETALEWMKRGRAVLLVPITAEKLGVGVGDTILVDTLQGEIEFTVAGIGGIGYNFTAFSYADGEAFFGLVGPSWLGIVVSEGEDVDAAIAQVQSAIEPFEGVSVGKMTPEALEATWFKIFDQVQMLLNALLLLAVIVAALGVVNTVVINVAERRREIALMRAVGATQRQVRQSVAAEAATLGLMAALVATALGLITLSLVTVVLSSGGAESVGFRVSWELAASVLPPALRDLSTAAALSLVFGPLVAALAAQYPARQAAALDVVEATRSERVALKRMPPSRRLAKRPEGRRKMTRSLTWTMAWRNLEQSRLRTALSALAVALGTAMIIAADVIANASRNALQTVDERNLAAFVSELVDLSLTIVGIVILVAAGFLVFNAFAMAITQRRRQVGSLRSLGMTRRQVMQLVLVEALITGGSGTLLGLVAGPLLGRGTIGLLRMVGRFVGTTLDVFGEPSISLSSLTTAAALGMGITLLATLAPAWQATRISPLTALREQVATGIERTAIGRALAGLLIIAALAVYLIFAPPGTWVTPPWDGNLSGLFALTWLIGLGLVLPGFVAAGSSLLRKPLGRTWGATGRLIADNLRRNRRRITLTILTLAVGLTTIVSVTGVMSFMFDTLLDRVTEDALQRGGWLVLPIDFNDALDVVGRMDLDTMYIPPELAEAVHEVASGRAEVGDLYMANVPELSFIPGMFSYVLDPEQLQGLGTNIFTFNEGDWETALPILESGCGVLIAPAVAHKNGVWLGETFEVTGANGPIECTVAGIGRSSFANVSLVSLAAREALGIDNLPGTLVTPHPGVDRAALEADLAALVERYPGTSLADLSTGEKVIGIFDTTQSIMNSMLLLAILAAALGVVNTTVVSIQERRRELGLLRAVGATRRQIVAVVTGEAALMGLLGGGLGLVAGAGVTAIVAVTYGGNAWGIQDLALWPSAWASVRPALLNGLFGVAVAPFICAGAAWFPARSILRGPAIETMEPERQETRFFRKNLVSPNFLSQGSIRTRFVLGTATLIAVVLAGLVAVVTTHARVRIEEQMHDALRTMVTWDAGMIELGLPDDAETLDLYMLQTGQTFDFDSDAMLRFESLMDDMTPNGLVDFTIADRDNVVLIGLDTREIGTLAPELEMTDEAHVYSEREASSPLAGGTEGGWLMHATAPVRNDDGLVVGSVRLTVDAREIQDFINRLRNALGAIGAGIGFVGLAISWGLGTPLVRATRQLAAHAAGVGRGEHTLYDHPARRRIGTKISLRAELTIALVLILALMVSVLEAVAIPVERRHVEGTLKDGLVAGAEWIGQAASESFDVALSDLSPDELPTFEQVLSMTETLDLARLQELTDQMRSDDVAYTALVDEEGRIVLSDRLALIGEEAPLPSDTRIEETTWRGEDVWVASTPLRRGREGEQIGALRMAVRRNRVETFLDESRNLFRLTGLIAVLAGVLLAQAIGGAVTAPVRQLAAGTRRIAEGDLSVHFDLDTKDELVLLANAYNQMVVGLREREWLRDMFGRFVSHEVAEAIRTRKVRLEGENRVVSVLFCDIRDFTARSERSTPEEVVALLNEYLPVVVDAAQRHEGTVNKFGGDSTLVIYGAPNPLQESAYQAVSTALEMRANLKQLNERLVEQGEAPIHIGVGINTGVALAGAVGPPERQEYTVIGDTVNLASRIEALNKAYPDHDVLISGWTYEALGSRRAEFEFADLGEVRIRGKAEPVRVWAVVKKR